MRRLIRDRWCVIATRVAFILLVFGYAKKAEAQYGMCWEVQEWCEGQFMGNDGSFSVSGCDSGGICQYVCTWDQSQTTWYGECTA